MKVLIFDTSAEAYAEAATILQNKIQTQPNAVLGLATGGTMLRVYTQFVTLCREAGTSLSEISTFNLDEYIGFAPQHPASYHSYMHENLFSKTDIDLSNTHLPQGDVTDPDEEAQRYEALITKVGGIDLQLLGIGRNGHIGFNEPSSSLASRTRVKTLTIATHDANRQYFDSDNQLPKCALTMGVGTILDSLECLLIATGENKAEAVAKMVEGPVSASCPASALQFHRHATVILDQDAASQLRLLAYYQHVHPNGGGA